MPENRPGTNRRPPVKRKKRRYNPFRLSLILVFYLAGIIVSFLIYAANFDISSKPAANSQSTETPSYETVVVTDADGLSVTDEDGNTVTEINETETSVSPAGNPVPESERQPDSYLEECVFIGDSISTGLSGYKIVPAENVLADVGLRIDNIETAKVKNPRFSEPVNVMAALESIKPENVYILLGSNGVAWCNNDSMLESYAAFVDDIKTKLPVSNVYIISITPVGTMKENIDTIENGKVLNSEIDQFNERLLSLADEKNVHFVNVNPELKDSTGKLPDDVTSDGMHFNKPTYTKFINYILTHTAK